MRPPQKRRRGVTQLVAGVRAKLASYPDIGRLFNELYSYITRTGTNGLSLIGATIWHDDEYKTSDIDGEAVVYLKQAVPATDRVKVYELPGMLMATVIHKGAYNTLNLAYAALGPWIESNGYVIVGPTREIYLESSQPVRQDDDSYVTELQFPVAKK